MPKVGGALKLVIKKGLQCCKPLNLADTEGGNSNSLAAEFNDFDTVNLLILEQELEELFNVFSDWHEYLEKDVYKHKPALRRSEP